MTALQSDLPTYWPGAAFYPLQTIPGQERDRHVLKYGIFDWLEHRDAPLDEIFEQRLQMLEHADKTGFHAYHVAEHQGTPLSLDSSPPVFMAAATQRTQRLRLIPTVFCLPWYNPFRLYNEICMLDQLSKGRLEVGIGRGVSPIEGTYYGVTS